MNFKRIFISIFTVIAFLLPGIEPIAQQIKIKINGIENNSAVLLSIEGEKTDRIDSLFSNNGVFQFSLRDKHTGFYRLQLDDSHYVNFTYDGTDVQIKTNYNDLLKSLIVNISESNKLYYNFLKLNKDYKVKSELLNLILQRYPKDDNYFSTTEKKLNQLQTDYLTFVNVTAQKDPTLFIARYIRSAQLPVIDGSSPFDKQMNYLKAHALDNVDFNDDELIFSDLFTNKTIEYLSYYRNSQLPKALLEKEFMKAIDTLLYQAKVNEAVYQHITEYLIDGFTNFGFETIVNYIVENYVIKDDLCIDASLSSSIQKRIDQAKFFKSGQTVPNIILPNNSGKEINLNKIDTEKVLIMFYASWCPHCNTIMPALVELYNNQKEKKIEILAVSLDDKKDDWINFIEKNKMNWVNVSDLKGWNGKAASDYLIYATPTFFLVNKSKKLLAKPLTIEEIRNIFE